jgi:hypothetical protein
MEQCFVSWSRMHKVACFSVLIDVDVKKSRGRVEFAYFELAYFEPVDVDVRKRKQTNYHDNLLEMGPSMFATRT